MAYNIGKIYKRDFDWHDQQLVLGAIGLACVAGPILAMEAAILLGPVAKGAIAAGIVKTMGEAIIAHCEAKYPIPTNLVPVQTTTQDDGRERFICDNFVGVIQAFNSRYAVLSHNSVVYCDSVSNGELELFYFTEIGSGEFALRAANDKFVMANWDNNKTLEACADSVKEWERFRLVKNGDGTFSILSVDTKQFVSADQNREQIMFADRNEVGEWERFKIFEAF